MAKKQPQGPSGLMVIDKPAGMSSHDAVSQMRRIAGTRRVGHAGTLDPAATGVLILGINKATKLLTYLVGQDKTYDATIRLGIETLTEDAEGEHNAAHPDAVEALTGLDAEQMRARILEAVAQLSGDILQVPSAVSAIKINGVRSYARVRSGEQVELAARPVTISEFTVHSVTPGFAEYVIEDPENEGEHAATSVPVIDCEVTVSCSSGTYIRALARDLGKILGTGGHLTALRRTRVGAVVLEDAADLAQLKQRREESEAPLEDLPLLPLEEAARRIFGARELTAAEASDISYGRRISPSGDGSVVKRSVHASADESGAVQHASVEGIVAGFAPDGTLVALLENKKQRGKVQAAPVLVFEANRSFN
ncbi:MULTISPECIES: tRNA pseudouridine(55) synthase TruB [Rothia]|uniref:tRNA pseudouridine(55) synthase TruB n=1 Tax=Rothia TaxID=32207 RepID=UPI0008A86928|nr:MULTISPECIES: tRNA pseudouridine(55) synthase TruB [Rothia]OHP54692.1 pseudouridine synthase [Rothia sp. HMSC061D12]